MSLRPLLFASYFLSCLIFASCIGDDIIDDRVEPEIRLINPIDTLGLGEEYTFSVSYFDNIGRQSSPPNLSWTSSQPDIIQIENSGAARALKLGSSRITAEVTPPDGNRISINFNLHVGQSTIQSGSSRKGKLISTSSYLLEGDFELKSAGQDVELILQDNYRASTALPGLVVYLTNNPNTNSSALELAAVKIFSGSHKYLIKNIGIHDYNYVLYYCKPFSVKVGHGEIGN